MNFKYLLQLLIIAGLLAISAFCVESYFERADMPPVIYFIIVGFAILTWLLHRFVMKANEKSPQRFVAHFMGSITIKLFVSVGFLTIYLFFFKAHQAEVALSLLVTYMVFTVYEVVSMQKLLRGK